MRSFTSSCVLPMVLVATLAIPIVLNAQTTPQIKVPSRPRYRVFDLGTLGGPNSLVESFAKTVNRHGTVAGWSDTDITNPSVGNPNPFFGPDPNVQHSFRWRKGILQDLGSLPGGFNSADTWINDRSAISGLSENGATDPLLGGAPATTPVIWKNGQIIDLGTFGGYEGVAWSINDHDQAVGMATNTVPDSYPDPAFFFPFGAQFRAFFWERGRIHDMGTLGGPSAVPFQINELGQAAGVSYTSFDAGPLGIPPVNPFFWDCEHGMIDLGSLGGVFSLELLMNNRGWVVGVSSLADDPVACSSGVGVPSCHAFLWRPGDKEMRDLGTLGGNYSDALWVDDSGAVVGSSTTAGDQLVRAYRWKNGRMTNLGSLNGDPCSRALSSNSKGQVVGISLPDCGDAGDAFLWESGSGMIDLNSLVPPNPDFQLHEPTFISENGEITGKALLTNGEAHDFLLIPCDGADPDDRTCGGGTDSASTDREIFRTESASRSASRATSGRRPRADLGRRNLRH